ncbi:MAG: hypothetical protein AAF711_04015, partial [Planctomycetota bacterium]
QPDKPSILHRTIPNRVMEWIFISAVAAFLVVLLLPTCSHVVGPSQATQDLSNIHQLLLAIISYAVDHDEYLPPSVLVIEDYLGTDSDHVFRSPFDDETVLVFDDTPDPGWYSYGSYIFLSAKGLRINDVTLAADLILVYRTPRPGSDHYLVGFLDGSAQVMSSEDFTKLMDQQGSLVRPLDDED